MHCPTKFHKLGNPNAWWKHYSTIYVKNTSLGLSLTLDMSASNWNPVNANGPVTVTWNQVGTRLQPGQSVAAILTLMVSSSITDVTNFSVQINIIGTS